MGDSMDEELDRGGALVAAGSESNPFPDARRATGYNPVLSSAGRGAVSAIQVPAVSPVSWARKRGRGDGGQQAAQDALWMGASGGGNAGAPIGRESPDSDMSSTGSEMSINRGIKRLRIGLQQQQQQYQLRQTRNTPSAFDLLSSVGTGESTPPLWDKSAEKSGPIGAPLPGALSAVAGLNNQMEDPSRPRLLSVPVTSPDGRGASSSILGRSEGLPQRSYSNNHLNTSAPPAMAGANTGTGSNEAGMQSGRSASFDYSASFQSSGAQSSTQARYLRGIRVQADAPADVDYSGVNHALRQLHMERRIMAARRAGLGESSAGGDGSAMGRAR